MIIQKASPLKSQSSPRIAELDVLRGLAALGTVLFHFSLNDLGKELGWSFRYGVAGVDLFFIISGFVIFMTVTRTPLWRQFAMARFARLFPAYWACMTITAVTILFFEPGTLTAGDVVANATMAPIFFNVENLDGSYWTTRYMHRHSISDQCPG